MAADDVASPYVNVESNIVYIKKAKSCQDGELIYVANCQRKELHTLSWDGRVLSITCPFTNVYTRVNLSSSSSSRSSSSSITTTTSSSSSRSSSSSKFVVVVVEVVEVDVVVVVVVVLRTSSWLQAHKRYPVPTTSTCLNLSRIRTPHTDPVVEHFYTNGHSVADFRVMGLQKLNGFEEYRKTIEQLWKRKLRTFKPYGLNVKD
ncbi:hypothetical protein DPMN_145123 [Dreissena polymorpha]|uniref:Uncharacterized protein n=1 Tax=Dreissena polymorpha TaxID=45954 RepID=A0A9D4F3C7_DREPO|nr:hypothetical protein DPMN_145123 [Dreissena polymorpha]